MARYRARPRSACVDPRLLRRPAWPHTHAITRQRLHPFPIHIELVHSSPVHTHWVHRQDRTGSCSSEEGFLHPPSFVQPLREARTCCAAGPMCSACVLLPRPSACLSSWLHVHAIVHHHIKCGELYQQGRAPPLAPGVHPSSTAWRGTACQAGRQAGFLLRGPGPGARRGGGRRTLHRTTCKHCIALH